MARLPRITIPGLAYHVTQRGNRRIRIFIEEDDYALYRLILAPDTEDGVSRAVGETHRRYSGYINARLRVTSQLFQGRFGSVAMDEAH
ncbi:MAG: transposase [Gammaproteobacteria bacterium]|nr:transposase [Gammaproteobacteria bacterium]